MKKNLIRGFLKFIFVLSIFITNISMFTFADWMKENGKYKYFNSATNQFVVNNWLQTGNGYYYLDSNGYTATGWYIINGKYYYFNDDGLMQVGFQDWGGKRYYLDEKTGQMVTGWVQVYKDGIVDYYYFKEDGSMATGWWQVDSKWYYFYDGKALVDTFAKINDLWYHFNVKGYMDTGWLNVNGKMYYLNVSNGSLTKGWIQDQNGYEYYLSEVDGSLTINTTINIGGRSYTFNESGQCIAKDQYSTITNGTSQQLVGILGNTVTGSVYGVNVGISPGSNYIEGAITSTQQQVNSANSLSAGSTTGPK